MGKKAFTLVELLVVIAIIAMLMAILMPSLAKARRQAKQIYCLNNLRQLAIAATNYTISNDGYYPISRYTETIGAVGYEYCWDFSRVSEAGQSKIVPGILWQGEKIEKVQSCPSYKGSDNWWSVPFTGYNYNTSYIGHGPGQSIETPAKVTHVKRPVSCALFGDGQYAGGANKFMRSPLIWKGDDEFNIRVSGTQGFRHNEMTNVAWCDGHADSQKQLYTQSYPNVSSQLEKYNRITKNCKIGFISSDNRLYDLE